MTERLAHYELLRLLGRGGMGEVHLAQDTRLDRQVALKLLPPELADDPERRARFLREARAAASLSHPNITTIYDVGEVDGRDYIAQEFLEGRTLSEILAERRLPLDELVELAVPLADALQYAHERGVIHRDLKPANIIVTPRGHAKLLDFGLAKLLHDEGRAGDPGEMSTTLTISGAVFGTPSAMSPEQALGKAVDARSDVFSFGALLYEMAAGKPAFLGTTIQETINKVLNVEPEPLERLRRDLPADFTAIVAKALRKDPGARYASMADLVADLRHFKRQTDSGLVPPGASSPARGRATRLAGAGVVLAIAAGVLWWTGVLGGGPRVSTPASFRQQQLTYGIGHESQPSLSADGRTLYYTGDSAGNQDIFMRRVDGSRELNLTEDHLGDDFHPSVSPDGGSIAFRSQRDGGGVFVMGSLGESPRKISELGFHPAWSPDGSRLAVCTERIYLPTSRLTTSALWVIDVATGRREQVYAGDAVQPRWSPDGKLLVAWQIDDGQRDLIVVPLDGGAPHLLTSDPSLDWAPVFSGDGRHVIYSSNRGGTLDLWQIPVDEQGVADGPAVPLTSGEGSTGIASPSADGDRIVFTSTTILSELNQHAFDSEALSLGPARPLSSPPLFIAADLSPDGRYILGHGGGTQEDIYRIDVTTGAIDQLTNDPFNDRTPRYLPDGDAFVFYSTRGGDYQVWRAGADGRDLRQVTWIPGESFLLPRPSPDGEHMLLFAALDTFEPALADAPLERIEQMPRSLPSGPDDSPFTYDWTAPTFWTPDGRAILGRLDDGSSQPAGLFLFDIETMSGHRVENLSLVPTSQIIGWLPDGRLLLIKEQTSLVVTDLQSGAMHPVAGDLPPADGSTGLLSRDGTSLTLQSTRFMSHIWLLER